MSEHIPTLWGDGGPDSTVGPWRMVLFHALVVAAFTVMGLVVTYDH